MNQTFICILDERGKIVYEDQVYTDPHKISQSLEKSCFPLETIGFESGSLSGYLTRTLKELGYPVICIDSRKMAAILSVTINKTDKNDARGIADAVRCQHYKVVHPKTEEEESLGVLLKSRHCLVNQRKDLKNTIRGFLKTSGIRLGSVSPLRFSALVRSHFENLLTETVQGLGALLTCFDQLTEQIKTLEKELKKIARQDNQIQNLMTVPGVGLIVSLSFKASLGDPSRFSKSISVRAYYGMTPRQYASGETMKQGSISKCGSSQMRYLLTEAAVVLLTRIKSRSHLKTWGLKLKAKYGLKKAATAVARKLSVLMHRMLITGESFKYGS